MVAREGTTGIVSQCSLLIPQVAITEPVIDAATDTIWIGTISVAVAGVHISIVATVVAAATAEQPVTRIKDRYVNAGAGGRCHGTQQSDRQKQGSDAESHTGFLGETERTEVTTENRANAGVRSRREVRPRKLDAQRLQENSKLTQAWTQIKFGRT